MRTCVTQSGVSSVRKPMKSNRDRNHPAENVFSLELNGLRWRNGLVFGRALKNRVNASISQIQHGVVWIFCLQSDTFLKIQWIRDDTTDSRTFTLLIESCEYELVEYMQSYRKSQEIVRRNTRFFKIFNKNPMGTRYYKNLN